MPYYNPPPPALNVIFCDALPPFRFPLCLLTVINDYLQGNISLSPSLYLPLSLPLSLSDENKITIYSNIVKTHQNGEKRMQKRSHILIKGYSLQFSLGFYYYFFFGWGGGGGKFILLCRKKFLFFLLRRQ